MAVKRILIFSFVYYPRFIGGAEIAIKEITDRLDKDELEFHLIALKFDVSLSRYEKIGNVHVHRIGWSGRTNKSADSLPWYLHLNKYIYPFLAAYKASILHREHSYQGIWAMMANYSGFGALFFKVFHMDVPFILTLQEGDPIEYIQNKAFKISVGPLNIPVKYLVYWLFKMIFTQANHVQAISHYLADFAKSMGATAPVTVIPNGVDVAHFAETHSPEALKNLRQNIGKKSGDIFLVTTSRLVVKNAVGDVIESLVHLPPHIKFLVIGVGYELEKLKALASKLDVLNRVIFLGYISHAEMPKYLHISDVFIRPSLSEGFGNSFIEAMAARVPVIATPVGGIVDFLKHKETGLFCEVSSPEDIARKVEMYLKDINLRQEIIENAFTMVSREYDWNFISRRMKHEVFDILGK